jgi:hypothetical protein
MGRGREVTRAVREAAAPQRSRLVAGGALCISAVLGWVQPPDWVSVFVAIVGAGLIVSSLIAPDTTAADERRALATEMLEVSETLRALYWSHSQRDLPTAAEAREFDEMWASGEVMKPRGEEHLARQSERQEDDWRRTRDTYLEHHQRRVRRLVREAYDRDLAVAHEPAPWFTDYAHLQHATNWLDMPQEIMGIAIALTGFAKQLDPTRADL